MKRLLLILPVLGLAACAGHHPDSSTQSAAYPNDALPDDSREPGHVHTYLVNDYVDPNNPRALHRGHPVEVVEQDEKWNLDSSSGQDDGNSGPPESADDPNGAPNPYSAEFETELSQQREQSQKLAAMGARMTVEMGKLETMAEKEADTVSENAVLRTRLQELQREIDELKPLPNPPLNPNAPKKSSLLDSIFELFRMLPDGTPVAADKPKLRADGVLAPVPPANLPPASTNDAEEIPSPGEIAQPPVDSNTSTNTP